MADRKTEFREKLAADLDYEKVRQMLEDAMDSTKKLSVMCEKCGHRTPTDVTDYRSAILAAEFWAGHGFGKAAIAKQIEQADFSKSDPLALGEEERGQLLEKMLLLVGSDS